MDGCQHRGWPRVVFMDCNGYFKRKWVCRTVLWLLPFMTIEDARGLKVTAWFQ